MALPLAFRFLGHNPTKQNLKSPDDPAGLPHLGIGEWLRGDVKLVTADTAEYLRQVNSKTYETFHELSPAEVKAFLHPEKASKAEKAEKVSPTPAV